MLEKTTIARPYAQAVFELAQEAGDEAVWADSLALLNRIVADPQMQSLLGNPRVTQEQLLAIFDAVGADQISPAARNLVRVLADAGRLRYMPQIVRLFEAMRAEAEGKVEVRVSSAYELNDAQQQQIADDISRRLGKQVSLSVTVDAALIGGAVIRMGDSVIDASLSGRLQALGNALA
ncbi:MAG: F0F1 ATP synthase subunit delta [Gammaproteobacteria bacterium]